MAKTLTEQTHLWPASDGNALFGAPAALHSQVPFDMVTAINNLGTHVEPTFQFAVSSGLRLGQQNVWTYGSEGGGGEIFLGELPVMIAYDALSLCWTLGLRRARAGETGTITTNIQSVYMFLCTQPAGGAVTAGRFVDRTLLRYLDYRQVVINETSDDIGAKYKMVSDVSPGWKTFKDKLPGIKQGWYPQPYIAVFTATIDSATTGEHIDTKELSLWFEYA